MSAPPTEPLLTTSDVAKLLRVTPERIRVWVRAGEGPPAVRIGGRAIRFRPSDVQAWLDRRADTPQTAA